VIGSRPARTWLYAALLWLVATTQLVSYSPGQSGNVCSWSPDGLILLFVGRDGDRHFVARYDVATQSASRVFLAGHGDRIDTVQWCTDGKSFLAVTTRGVSPRRARATHATVHLINHPAGTTIKSFSPVFKLRESWGSPIYRPDRILVEAPALVELHPASGKMFALQRPFGEAHAVFGAFGAGIGYLSVDPSATGGWSLGSLHPTDLKRTTYCDSRLCPQADISRAPPEGGVAGSGRDRRA
jgi:hypothetical protein